MKLILHIGSPKTATTSLQHFFYHNRKALSESGFLLFDGLGEPNNIDFAAFFASNSFNNMGLWHRRRGILSEADKHRFFKSRDFVYGIERQIAHASGFHHTAIISSEQLSSAVRKSADIERLARFTNERFHSVQVVCFVRDQVEMIPSVWSTSLKSGSTASLAKVTRTAVLTQSLNYLRMANAWSEHFGKENMLFSLYRSDAEWDVRHYFTDRYLGGLPTVGFASERKNPSYSSLEANAVRLVNLLFPFRLGDGPDPNRMNLQAREWVARIFSRSDRSITLNPRQSRSVRETFLSTNSVFSREFLPMGESLVHESSVGA